MKSANWKDIAELTGIAAIVASLIFVGMQMQQTQDIAFSQASSQLLLDQIEWVNLKNANRDVWIRGNRGDELNEIEASAYRDLFQIRSSIAFFQYRRYEALGSEGDIFVADYATFLHQNAGARREWELERDHLEKYRFPLVPEEFRETVIKRDQAYSSLLRAKVEELDRLYGRPSLVQ